ncbi:hypothetical protein M1513_00770 [Patescibacteria group bacterium]|nr:hypothetical protein [Patescibacteria group bacterium]MCL5733043.1 hypothetical protein [Patescibacteria group bacterium]
MITNQLIDYIKNSLQGGASPEQIKSALAASGWQAGDIEDAFKSIDLSKFPNIRNVSQQSQNIQKDFSVSKKINSKLIAAIVIIGIIIAGGAAFGYYVYFRSLSPAEVIAKTLNNLGSIKSFDYQLNAQSVVTQNATQDVFGQPQPTSSQTVNIDINASGTADISDLKNIKTRLALLSNIGLQGMNLSPDLDFIKINNVIYLRVNNIPNFGFAPISSLENKWIEIDLAKINQDVQNSPLGQIKTQINQQLGQASSSPIQVSQAQINSIIEAALNSGVFEFSQALPGENIGGVNTYHYQFVLNKNNLADLIGKVAQIIKNNQLSSADLKGIQNIKNTLSNDVISPIDVWIGKNDFLPYRISYFWSNSNMPISSGSSLSIATSTTLFSFTNFNQPTNIVAPGQAEPIQSLFQSMMGNIPLTTNSGNNVGSSANNASPVDAFIYLSDGQTLLDNASKLKFQVLTLTLDSIKVNITDPKTGQAQIINLTLRDKAATELFGYKISLNAMDDKDKQAIIQVTNLGLQ